MSHHATTSRFNYPFKFTQILNKHYEKVLPDIQIGISLGHHFLQFQHEIVETGLNIVVILRNVCGNQVQQNFLNLSKKE